MGRRAGLDLRRIVDAAHTLDPETLTVQAVADVLGVDRKAVRHHVADLQTLLGLVALDRIATNPGEVDIPADATWQEALRRYARAFADAVIAADTLADHLRTSDSLPVGFGRPTEELTARLAAAGFDDEAILRTLALVANFCTAYARDVVFVSRGGERPRRQAAELILRGADHAYEHFTRVLAQGVDTYDARQFEIGVDVLVRGIEAVFPHADVPGSGRPGPP